MKIVLTGGCTGGHIYPALAIGDKFKEKQSDVEILYIAYADGLETEIVPKAGYELECVTAHWIERSNPAAIARTIHRTMKGRREAYALMKKFRPDVVVSTGSFVSVPVVLAGVKYGADVYIQEQNAFPGVSNKLLSKYAKKVFLGFEAGAEQFKYKDKLVYSGNPVRAEFYGRKKLEDRRTKGIPENDFVITVFGGSLGANTINGIGKNIITKYGNRPGVSIIFGVGKNNYEDMTRELEEAGLSGMNNVRMLPYIDDMPRTLSASDVVICRAGALSVAEVTMSGTAAIFIPSPNVTADHQYFNAKAVADIGGAFIVRESETSSEETLEKLDALLCDEGLAKRMGENTLKIAPYDATEIIYNNIMETYGR